MLVSQPVRADESRTIVAPVKERHLSLSDIAPAKSHDGPLKRRNRKIVKLLVFVLAVGVTGTALRMTVLATRPVPVQVARVTRGAVEQTVSNTRAGTVKLRRRARLSPESGGRVVELPHREGARISRGGLLLRLDSSIQKAQLELAEEDIRVAAARADEACLAVELAETELRRIASLRQSDIVSDQIVDGRRSERDRSAAACRAARAGLDQARARERLAKAELARTELRAPFDGVVAEVSTEVGEWITPSPPAVPVPPVLDLLDPTSVYITAPIDEMDAERVELGQEVRVRVDSRQGEQFPGLLVRVAPYVLDVVEQNRTVEVEAELSDRLVAESLLPGTSADIEVVLLRHEEVLQIPTGAIGPGGEVLVVVDGRLEARTITPGLRNWRTTEVLAGLVEGDLVVTSRDTTDIKAGALVHVPEAL